MMVNKRLRLGCLLSFIVCLLYMCVLIGVIVIVIEIVIVIVIVIVVSGYVDVC